MEQEASAKKEKEADDKFDSFIRDIVLGFNNDKLVVPLKGIPSKPYKIFN